MRPVKFARLVKGKSVTAVDGFVDTFNYLVDFVQNLKGDKDVNKKTGSISLSLAKPESPVIRWEGGATGGGGGGNSTTCKAGAFSIKTIDLVAHRLTLQHCYWRRSGRFKIYSAQPFTVHYTPGKILCMNISELPPGDTVTFVSMTAAELAAFDDVNNTRIPLYEFAADGKLLADLRIIPINVAWEV